VDSKKYWVKPKNLKVYCNIKEGDYVIEHPGVSKPICLNYYACVQEDKGAVAIKFVTGTAGHKKKYKVSCTNWWGQLPTQLCMHPVTFLCNQSPADACGIHTCLSTTSICSSSTASFRGLA
jgi:hypothetical protein